MKRLKLFYVHMLSTVKLFTAMILQHLLWLLEVALAACFYVFTAGGRKLVLSPLKAERAASGAK